MARFSVIFKERLNTVKPIILILNLSLCAAAASAEMRTWTLKDGKQLEAEFVLVNKGRVFLKTPKGKEKKIPMSNFSEEDTLHIELLMPPNLEFDFSNFSKARVFPDSLSKLPQSYYQTFKVSIKRGPSAPYKHELTAEFFVIGAEIAGDKKLLLDYQKESFYLPEDSYGEIEMASRVIELTRFDMGGEKRGDEYDGCIVAVTDSRGVIIAYKTKDENWLRNIENLRKVPIGKTFDESCNRCMPTRPRKFY